MQLPDCNITRHFPHPKVSRSYSTCLLQHGCRNYGETLLLPTGCPKACSCPPPSSLSTGQQWASFATSSRPQTQWHCPQHGPLSSSGRSTLWKLTGFRQTVFSVLIAPTFTVLHLPLSLSIWKKKKVQPLPGSGEKQVELPAFSESAPPPSPL